MSVYSLSMMDASCSMFSVFVSCKFLCSLANGFVVNFGFHVFGLMCRYAQKFGAYFVKLLSSILVSKVLMGILQGSPPYSSESVFMVQCGNLERVHHLECS